MTQHRSIALRAVALALVLSTAGAGSASAQWSTTYEQFYLPAKHNWQFRHYYPAADRLFNAFDFGHAILYETLWTDFDNSVQALEQKWYDRLTKDVLLHPPRVPLEEAAIEIAYAKLAPEAKQMFDWAHLLHRQIYDVWADERIPVAEKDARIAELVRYYKTRPDLAFSSKPKSMELMQEQPFSLAFRKGYPKFNGLIWAYHWLQIGLYEPLVIGRNVDERQAGVRTTVARFWQMLQNPPHTMPYVMPMTAAVAPEFSKRYPEASIIFDNLHSMHDVVSDILANPDVPRKAKREEIMLAARRYRDDTTFVMTEQAWRTMARHMGVENMGGVAGNALPPLPTPSVTIGAVMTHDRRTGEMTGFKYGQATGGEHAGMQHGATPGDSAKRAMADSAKRPMAMEHARMAQDSAAQRRDTSAVRHEGHQMADTARSARADSAHMQLLMDLHMRMMADPVIRERIMADSAMRRMMQEMMQLMPPEHRAHMDAMMREARPAKAAPTAPQPSAKRSAPKAQQSKPANPHAGHAMPPTKKRPSPPPPKKPSRP